MQDKDGFLWFGTASGLNRYDGYQFKVFTPEINNPNTISSSYISALWQSKDGIIWVGTLQGLNQYNTETNQFTPFLLENSKDLKDNKLPIKSIAGNGNEILWVGSVRALYKVNLENNKIAKYVFDSENVHSISDNTIRSILVDHSGTTWLGTSDGLNRYDSTSDNFTRYLADDKSADLGVNALFESKENLVWAGTDRGLYLYDSSSNNFELFLSTPNKTAKGGILDITSITQDDQGNIWLGTDRNGLCLLQMATQECQLFKHDKSDKNSLNNNKISDVYFDQQGRVWIASISSLNYFLSYRPFASYSSEIPLTQTEKELLGKPVTAVMYDNTGALWVSFYDYGLVRYNKNHQVESIFRHDPEDEFSLGNNRVLNLFQTKDGVILASTQGKGLYQFNSSDNNFKHIDSSPSSVYAIVEDNSGDLWIGSSKRALEKFNLDTREFIDVNKQYGTNTTITSLFLSSSGSLFVGHLKGITIIDLKSNIHKSYSHDPDNPESLSHNIASSFSEDQQGNIWIGTLGGGVNKFNIDTESFTHYRKEDGLADNTVYSILQDNDEKIWIGTQYGLSKLDPARNTFKNFYSKDGLLSNDFNMSSTISDSGEIVLANNKGLQKFLPSTIKAKEAPGKLSFTNFKLFNKPVLVNQTNENTEFLLQQSIETSKEINLTYKELLFSFEFAVLNALAPKKIKYAYRLSGWDDDWIYTDHTNRVATYTNIPHGEYQLELKATDQNGNWREDIKSIKLNISPPFWKTKFAYFTYIFFIIILAYLLLNIRTRSLVRRASLLEKSVESRTLELAKEKETVEQLLQQKNEEFANVSHEFRTPLTLILGLLAQVLKTNNNPTELNQLNIINRNSYRLLRMVDQLLNLETFRVHSITHQTHQAVGSIIKQISGAFRDFAKEKNIDLEIGQVEAVNFKFTSDAIEKIIANLISNAIKYTPSNGKIRIHSERVQGNQLLIQVSDTGVGIPDDKIEVIFERYSRVLNENSEQVTGAGIGLALVKELVESHNGEITIESKLGTGTTVKVLLPIIDEVDNKEVNISSSQETITMELMGITNHISDAEPEEINQIELVNDRPTVLVVEDNQDMRNYITERFSTNYNVITAKNGQEGVDIGLAEIPDLIISDIMMPIKDGYELTNEIRQNPITSHIPIILLTAKGDKESRLKGWYERADEYLTKPFDIEELVIRVSNLLGIRNILKKRYSELAFQTNSSSLDKIEAEHLTDADGKNTVDLLQQKFIEQLNTILEKHYTDPATSIKTIASDFAMSERQFFRKLRSVVDMTPTDYLRRFRLEKSRELLQQGLSIKNIVFDVGFNSQSYFGRCFKAQYGISPKEYAKKHSNTVEPSLSV